MTALKLPKPPDYGTRSETEAFLAGFELAMIGIKKAFPAFKTEEIWKSAKEFAMELYPPFEPPPPPVKCRGDGRRADGIEMSED